MAAIDVAAKVRTTALAVVERACLGEDFGVDSTATLVPGPTGVVVVYTLVLSLRSPLLGQGPLVVMMQIPSPNPSTEQVEHAVTEGMKGLRDLSSEILRNGNAAAVLTG